MERNHRNLNEFFRIYINENIELWEEYLRYFAFCYNTTKHSSFNEKYSPYELVYGHGPRLPRDFNSGKVETIYNIDNYAKIAKYRIQRANKLAKLILEKLKIRNKNYFDKRAKPINIEIGNEVWAIVDRSTMGHTK